MTTDSKYMQRALALASQGRGITYPNPMVGAVIVKEDRVIGEGWHHGPGLPHAEVEALRNCQESTAGATLYVSLEPCNHYGKTPPCTEAIINAGIKEVWYASADPNPEVGGQGARRLAKAGVKTVEGLLKAEAVELNRAFFHYCLKRRPWVILKAGMSLDAKLTSPQGESQWITGPESREKVHRLRFEAGAVLVGRGTMQADNPRLTCRLTETVLRQPLKVVVDGQLVISPDCKLVQEAPERLIIACSMEASREKEIALQRLGARVIRYPQGQARSLAYLLDVLGKMGVQSLLVEGGAQIFTSLVEADLVDEYYLFYAPLLIGGITSLPVIQGSGIGSLNEARRLQIQAVQQCGADVLIHAYKEELAKCLPV